MYTRKNERCGGKNERCGGQNERCSSCRSVRRGPGELESRPSEGGRGTPSILSNHRTAPIWTLPEGKQTYAKRPSLSSDSITSPLPPTPPTPMMRSVVLWPAFGRGGRVSFGQPCGALLPGHGVRECLAALRLGGDKSQDPSGRDMSGTRTAARIHTRHVQIGAVGRELVASCGADLGK